MIVAYIGPGTGPELQWPDPIGFVAFALLIGAFGALPLALGLVALYRVRVRAWMSKKGRGDAVEPKRSAGGNAPPEPRIEIIDRSTELDLPEETRRLADEASRRPQRLALAYTLAAVVHAAIAGWVYLDPFQEGFYPRRALVVLLVLAWPLVPTVALVAIDNRRLKWLAPVVFLVLALLLGGGDAGSVLIFWLYVMAVPTLLALLVAAPALRGVAPFAFALVGSVTAGLVGALFLFVILTTRGLEQPLHRLTVFLLLLLGVAAGLAPLLWAAHRYRRKKTGDQALLIDTWWFFLTAWLCLVTAGEIGTRALLFVVAFVGYKLALWLGLTLFVERRPTAYQLLLLRVFRRPRESTRLLRRLEMYWRQLGSIQMIMAPDLAVATLEPHDVVDFLSFRLGRKFIASEADLEARLAEADHAPDPDGRFRVNELFCRADTWKAALRRLVEESPTVMDLRGFGPYNQGCRYELGTLLDVVPTRRFVLIGSDEPDEDAHLRHTLVELWADLSPDSPNRDPQAAPIRIVRDDARGAVPVDRLLRLLCAAAVQS